MEGAVVEEIAALAERATEAQELETGKVYLLHERTGTRLLDLTGDQYRDQPQRIRETVAVDDVESFLIYWGRHADEESTIYADQGRKLITGVLDAHGNDRPRWQTHRVELRLEHTPEFKRWLDNNGRQFAQDSFAEFLEDHRQFVVEPDAATMVELAQSFQATTKAEFAAGFQVQSGQRQLTYTETVKATAGNKGQLTIPDLFVLGLPVFKGAQVRDRVVAKLRFRVANGELRLFYVLDGIEDVIAGAFHDVRQGIADSIADGTMVNGTAPSGR